MLTAACSDPAPPRSDPSGRAAAPPSPASCEGEGADLGPLGVRGSGPEEFARSFAALLLRDTGSQQVVADGPCAASLQPSNTRFSFGRSEGGALRLLRASSFTDGDSPALSLQVTQGRVVANTPIGCVGCVSIAARVVSRQGVTPETAFRLKEQIELSSNPGWTSRGLLLRFLDSAQRVRGVLVVSFSDGDFAAG